MLRLTSILAGLCCTLGPTSDSAFDWTGKIPVGATLRVADFHGDIDATAASGDQVEVHGWKRGPMIFEVVRHGDNVVICAYPKDDGGCNARGVHGSWHGGHAPQADFRVRLPAGVLLDANTGDGRVTVRGVRSDVHAASGDGEIQVEDVDGRVVARTGDGAIRVSTVHAVVDASSGTATSMSTSGRSPSRPTCGCGRAMGRSRWRCRRRSPASSMPRPATARSTASCRSRSKVASVAPTFTCGRPASPCARWRHGRPPHIALSHAAHADDVSIH